MITCEDLCYVGLRVRVDPEHENLLCGCAKSFYEENGYLYVTDWLSENSVGVAGEGLNVSMPKSALYPIDLARSSILDVLDRKKREVINAEAQVRSIQNFINKTVYNVIDSNK